MSLHRILENTTGEERNRRIELFCKTMRENKLPRAVSIPEIADAVFSEQDKRTLRTSTASEGVIMREAVDPVNLKAFNNITGNLILQPTLEAYKSADFIADQLFTQETAIDDKTRQIGLGTIDDDAVVVKEGEEYKDVKFGEDYIDIPESDKRGVKIGITREMLFFDRTGQVIQRAREIGDIVGRNRELRMLRTFLGLDNTFKRKGVARNTYVAAADPRINLKGGTPLVDWTSVNNAWQLFATMTDDNAPANPINVMPDTLVVPMAKIMTARQIMSATEIRSVNGTETRIAANPVAGMATIITSPWITNLLTRSIANGGAGLTQVQADNTWFFGQPKKSFVYRTLMPLQIEASTGGTANFERDVVAEFKASERGVPYVRAPWYVAKLFDT